MAAANKPAPEPTIESLTADNARLTQENTQLREELAAAQVVIAEQGEALANAEAAQAVDKVIIVTYDGKQYRVLGKQFNIKGELVKAEELGKNKEALQHLVDTKSGLLQPVAKAK
ncbi:hypothetical protein [Hymenobacter sp. B81]|uniref:hypothetical protein n=1 Tax=Hymenobacter sp. B81 TaxID=3344878 RepID=UPI0037DDA78F